MPKVIAPDRTQARSCFCLLLLSYAIVCPGWHHLHQPGYFKTRQINTLQPCAFIILRCQIYSFSESLKQLVVTFKHIRSYAQVLV